MSTKFIYLFLAILAELYIVPHYTQHYTPFFVMVIGCISAILYIKLTMPKKSFKVQALLALGACLVEHICLRGYYNTKASFPVETFMFVIIIILVSYLTLGGHKEIEQLKSSPAIFGFITEIIMPLPIVFGWHAFFNGNVLKKITLPTTVYDLDLNMFIEDIILGYLLLMSVKLTCQLVSFENKEKTQNIIIKGYIVFIIAAVLFTLNYNPVINEIVYDSLMKYVPSPNNVYLYNSLAIDPNTRFRIMLWGTFFCDRHIIDRML